ncbi:MAG: SLBB domain-containing protein [Desulfocurvibacter africanus]
MTRTMAWGMDRDTETSMPGAHSIIRLPAFARFILLLILLIPAPTATAAATDMALIQEAAQAAGMGSQEVPRVGPPADTLRPSFHVPQPSPVSHQAVQPGSYPPSMRVVPRATPPFGVEQSGQIDSGLPTDRDPSTQRKPDGELEPEAEVHDFQAQGIAADAASDLERIYRERYASTLSARLTQFGYEFFASRPDLRQPQAPAEPGYVLGPGDVLGVRLMSASLDQDVVAMVSREGSLDLPGMGLLEVAGLSLSEAEKAVNAFAGGYAPGVRTKLRVARMRGLEVYVVGEVRRPGLVQVPGRATALTALIAAGGVAKSGSLRAIRVTRDGRTLTSLDLYGLLLHGDLGGDVSLASGDVVFVPRIGPTVAVAGAVPDPRIYELAHERNLAEVLSLAGGGLPQAQAKRILLRSFSIDGGFSVRDLDAAGQGVLEAQAVSDGDLLELRFHTADWPSDVRLEGHVRQPEVLAWREGLRLSDLLSGQDLLRPGAVTDFGLLRRWDRQANRWAVKAFPLAQVLAGGFDMSLEPHDVVEVLSRAAYGVSEPVSLRGAVWKEGDFEHTPGLTLVDLLALGGGLRFGAEASRIEVSRKRLENGKASTETMLIDLASAKSFALLPHDTVLVPSLKDAATFRQATIQGQVRYPGVYRIQTGEPLSSLIRRAGGFTPEAYFHGARFTSAKAREVQQQSLDRLVRELEMWADKILAEQAQTTADPEETAGAREARLGIGKLLSRLQEVKAEGRVAIVLANLDDFAASEYDFALEDGDVLEVPSKPSFISVVGSVYTPSSFLYRPETRVKDYLSKSGGPTRTADTHHMYLLKANGEVLAMGQDGMGSFRFTGLRLMPGDTLVVPEDLERVPYFRLFRGITDSLFKIATTAGIALAIL